MAELHLATSAIASGKITTLTHEVSDDPVEGAALEVQRLPRAPGALLACDQHAHGNLRISVLQCTGRCCMLQ